MTGKTFIYIANYALTKPEIMMLIIDGGFRLKKIWTNHLTDETMFAISGPGIEEDGEYVLQLDFIKEETTAILKSEWDKQMDEKFNVKSQIAYK